MEIQQTPTPDTTAEETGLLPDLDDRDPVLKAIVPGTMSGAEMLDLYQREGAFRDYPEIGPGRLYKDSTEYLLARRAQTAKAAQANDE